MSHFDALSCVKMINCMICNIMNIFPIFFIVDKKWWIGIWCDIRFFLSIGAPACMSCWIRPRCLFPSSPSHFAAIPRHCDDVRLCWSAPSRGMYAVASFFSTRHDLSIYTTNYLYIYHWIYLSTYLPTYLSIYLSVYLSINQSISIYLSIYDYMHSSKYDLTMYKCMYLLM